MSAPENLPASRRRSTRESRNKRKNEIRVNPVAYSVATENLDIVCVPHATAGKQFKFSKKNFETLGKFYCKTFDRNPIGYDTRARLGLPRSGRFFSCFALSQARPVFLYLLLFRSLFKKQLVIH